jgi:hypothetical protein
MQWKLHVNNVLSRTTGYQLTRLPGRGPVARSRLAEEMSLVAPVFIFCSVRSGSTLLRSVLGSHSELHAPHELHLKELQVAFANDYVERAMAELGLGKRDLEHLLWDRVLAREVARHGKRYLVNKTPNDVFMWRRIAACWPDARFIFLLRHPAAIVRSWHRARPHWTDEEAIASGLKYMEAVEQARSTLPGMTVRYEELTADPEGTTQRVCEYLGLAWEPDMLDYAEGQRHTFRAGLGDWKAKIRSGRVQPAAAPPEPHDIPPQLKEICTAWEYL